MKFIETRVLDSSKLFLSGLGQLNGLLISAAATGKSYAWNITNLASAECQAFRAAVPRNPRSTADAPGVPAHRFCSLRANRVFRQQGR